MKNAVSSLRITSTPQQKMIDRDSMKDDNIDCGVADCRYYSLMIKNTGSVQEAMTES